MKQERVYYLDFIKAISIFMVVLMHCVDYSAPVGSFAWDICVLIGSITKFCIPAFVMTSGALMLNQDKKIPLKALYLKYILRFVIAYIFWSGAYALYSSELLFNIDIPHIKVFINNFIVGHFHLWYLWMLIGLYIILPVLRRIASDEKTLMYFVIVVFLASSVVPFIDAFLGTNEMAIVDNKLFLNINVYTAMFMAGYYIYNNSKKIKGFSNIGIVIIIVVMILATMIVTIVKKDLKTYFEDYMPFNIIYGLGVFYLSSKVKLSNKVRNIVTVISNNSFGIYLSHVFVIYLYNKIDIFIINNVLDSIAKTIFVFIVSFGVSLILRRIPIIGKYIS